MVFAVKNLLRCQVTLLNLLTHQSPRELEPGKLQPANPKLDLAQEKIQLQAVALCRASLPKPKALHSATTRRPGGHRSAERFRGCVGGRPARRNGRARQMSTNSLKK